MQIQPFAGLLTLVVWSAWVFGSLFNTFRIIGDLPLVPRPRRHLPERSAPLI
jgi:hypothetical protein